MIKRLVWNFEFTTHKHLDLADLKECTEEELKWESRFFWSESEIIPLNLMGDYLLNLAEYQHKQKQDLYCVLADKNYNIKYRRGELLYKPLEKRHKNSLGYRHKMNLTALEAAPLAQQDKEIRGLLEEAHNSPGIEVRKDSFIYKFPIHPMVRLELSRIEINHTIYFSLCVEGKSRHAVETISASLVGKKQTADYVGFLKGIANDNECSIPYYL